MFANVFLVQQQLTEVVGTLLQFSVEDFSWQVVGLHVVYMFEPLRCLLMSSEGMLIRSAHSRTLQQAPKTVEVKFIELLLLSGIGHPQLTAVKES